MIIVLLNKTFMIRSSLIFIILNPSLNRICSCYFINKHMIGRIGRVVMIYMYKLLHEHKCYVIVNDFGIVVISILSNFYMSIFGYVQSIKIKTYLLKIFSNVEFFTKYDNISIYNLMFRHFVIWSLCPINGHSRIVMSRIT